MLMEEKPTIPDDHHTPRYWASRSDQPYYRTAVRYARQFARGARSVLDVGSANCEYINWMDWIPERVRIDLQAIKPIEGAQTIQSDFMTYAPDRRFDLVLCLQVLEHLEEPGVFAHRLFALGRIVIISVPYRWPPRPGSSHVQDPVDEAKLLSWTGRPWLKMRVVKGRKSKSPRRLVAVFQGDACSPLRSIGLKRRAKREGMSRPR
jgi:hypothetical protein